MKVLSYLEARVVWYGPMELALPDEGARYAAIMPAIAERYNFQNAGLTENNGLPAFQHGEVVTKYGTAAVGGLEFQPAGIVALCTKTDIGDTLLQDLHQFLCANFGFKKDIKLNSMCRSSIVSQHEFDLERTLAAWQDTMNFACSMLPEREKMFSWRPSSIKFNAYVEERGIPENTFVFEKRVGLGAGPGVLFSNVPLTTESHVALLERFDANFSDRKG